MADDKVEKEMAEVMPLSHPPEDEMVEFHEREPDKVVPKRGSDGADTPSGAALIAVGAPDLSNPASEAERKRGLRYRLEKYKKRWLS